MAPVLSTAFGAGKRRPAGLEEALSPAGGGRPEIWSIYKTLFLVYQ